MELKTVVEPTPCHYGNESIVPIQRMLFHSLAMSFIGETPVVIVACGTESKSVMGYGQPTHTVDVSIACAYMILQPRALMRFEK